MLPILRGVKIIVFLLGATLAALFICVLLLSRPTAAESFLSKTVCSVTGILGLQCKQPTPTQPTPTQPSDPTPVPTTSGETIAPSTGSTSSQQAATQTPPLELETKPITALPVIPADPSRSTTLPSATGYLAYAVFTPKTDKQVLGAASTGALQTSEEGWRIYGVAWYWWVILTLSVVGMIMLGKVILSNYI